MSAGAGGHPARGRAARQPRGAASRESRRRFGAEGQQCMGASSTGHARGKEVEVPPRCSGRLVAISTKGGARDSACHGAAWTGPPDAQPPRSCHAPVLVAEEAPGAVRGPLRPRGARRHAVGQLLAGAAPVAEDRQGVDDAGRRGEEEREPRAPGAALGACLAAGARAGAGHRGGGRISKSAVVRRGCRQQHVRLPHGARGGERLAPGGSPPAPRGGGR
mmetsp:Transcript_60562/g.177057  ORF Transcript_60562/g.177057 Transcript_60562/m.177057 type:complete len:219 (-) Transcript_60562:449-1105(-)